MQANDSQKDNLLTPRIAVCILTRMRAAGLIRALEGLAKQQVPSHAYSQIRVIVIDNDPSGSGQPVCDHLRPTYPWPLDYALEPIIGIPYARNRALEMTMEEDDLIAFIDDDEIPSEMWLAELLRVWREYSADVVFGPVAPYFPDPVARWIEQGAFFEREVHPTGTLCTVGATNNVLMATRLPKQSGIRFDEAFRFSGGSDGKFFENIHNMGYRMIWADEALVTEWIPKSRTTLKWLAMRRFRNGITDFYGSDLSIGSRLRGGLIGLARIAVGVSCAVILFPLGRDQSAKAILWASFGLGLLLGALGQRFDEYRRVRPV